MIQAWMILILIGLISIPTYYAVQENNKNIEREQQEKEKREKAEEQRYQEKINELNPDFTLGSRRFPLFIKDMKLIYGKDKELNLKNAVYDFFEREILIIPTMDTHFSLFNIYIGEGYKKLKQRIIGALDECGLGRIKYWFQISEDDELSSYFYFGNGKAYAYKMDSVDYFKISGQKNIENKWYLINIEFAPHFVSDYEVETTSKSNGKIRGNAGAALVGGAFAGTTGAIIGSSMGQSTQMTTTIHSNNSAKLREIPATVLLTLKNSAGEKITISEKMIEEEVVMLKKHFLAEFSDNENKGSLALEIQKLEELFKQGVLTEEEFNRGKRKILDL